MTDHHNYWSNREVLVTGASLGLGRHLTGVLLERGARVTAIARRQEPLDALSAKQRHPERLRLETADLLEPDAAGRVVQEQLSRKGTLDAVFHCVGCSMRGRVLSTSVEDFQRLWETNFLTTLRLAQAAVPALTGRQGHFVAIGSLATRAASRYLGAYPATKAALGLFMHQLRLEHSADGLHALLVLCGPLARNDEGLRYQAQSSDLPAAAARPGGGVSLRSIAPDQLARRILRACERRDVELVVPWRARLAFALLQLAPAWGDWLIRRNTSSS